MKVEVTTPEPPFRPITITLESQIEVDALHNILLGVDDEKETKQLVEDGYPLYMAKMGVEIISGDLWDRLENFGSEGATGTPICYSKEKS